MYSEKGPKTVEEFTWKVCKMMKPYLSHTRFCNYVIGKKIRPYGTKTVLDVGGIGRFKEDYEVTDANIRKGIDGCDLPYEDNSFDAVISHATIEHCADYIAFLNEAVRVAKYASCHWVPLEPDIVLLVDKLKKRLKPGHPTTYVPTVQEIHDVLKPYKHVVTPLITISEHLLYLATIRPAWNCEELYEFILEHGDRPFGWMIFIEVGEQK